MASSNRREKQNRAKAAAKHAEARRRRAATARIRAVQARLSRIYDPPCCHAGKPDGEDHAEDYPDDHAQPERRHSRC